MEQTETRKIRVIQPGQIPTSSWSGGTTSQLGIGEGDCSYGERNFLWRLSSATVDDEVSEFTALPDYRRLILMQEGTVTLCHDDGPELVLEPWQVHDFDGASRTVCRGKARDFNLMLRKESADGSLTVLDRETKALTFRGAAEQEEKRIYAVYNCGADLEILAGQESFPVNAGGIFFLTETGRDSQQVRIREIRREKPDSETILAEISIKRSRETLAF